MALLLSIVIVRSGFTVKGRRLVGLLFLDNMLHKVCWQKKSSDLRNEMRNPSFQAHQHINTVDYELVNRLARANPTAIGLPHF